MFSVVWALLPLITFGLGTVFVIGSAAARLARQKLWFATSGYLLYFIVIVIITPTGDPPQDELRNNIAMTLYFAGMWGVGTIHAFLLRKEVFRPAASPPASATAPSPASTAPPPPVSTAAPSPASTPASPPVFTAPPGWNPWATAAPDGIGQYLLLQRLGEGGQGTVYLGQDPYGMKVAVKVLKRPFQGGDDERAAFMREVTAAQRVPQFSTAGILDVGVEGDTAYIVSEYVPGRSLERKVAEDGPYDEGGLIRLAIATAAALNAIHSAGVVHRDFKPANVLLGPDGPRVIDFGIAKALDTAHLTIGGIKGTPAYMSPEQARAEPVGPPSDIFSWASTMYYAATGTLAFTDVLHHQPHLDRVPAPLRTPITACFNKDPSRRPTAEQLMTAIAR